MTLDCPKNEISELSKGLIASGKHVSRFVRRDGDEGRVRAHFKFLIGLHHFVLLDLGHALATVSVSREFATKLNSPSR